MPAPLARKEPGAGLRNVWSIARGAAEQAGRLEGLMELLAETHARAAGRDPSLTLDALADVFERMRRDYR